MRTIINFLIFALILTAISLAGDTKVKTGKITGYVSDKESGEGIPGVAISIKGIEMGTASKFDGSYCILNVPIGNHSLIAIGLGYEVNFIDDVIVDANNATKVNIELEPKPVKGEFITLYDEVLVRKITGMVRDKESGEGIPKALVRIVGTSMGSQTMSDGRYSFFNVPSEIYALNADAQGYKPQLIDSVIVVEDSVTLVDFELEPSSFKGDSIKINIHK